MWSTRTNSRLRIAVLSGGDSAEREISLLSGAGVAAALAAAGHDVDTIDPRKCPLAEVDWATFDACFVALHGGAGEDGRVQRELERYGVPYTGSGPEACRLAMSKSASKERFVEHRVPTPPFAVIEAGDSAADTAARVAPLGYPLVVKPDNQGSSIGITIVHQRDELPRAVAVALAYDDLCLAERYVRGREFTVAVLDDRPLPMLEIVTPEPVFSYEAKYHSSLTEHRFDFELPATIRAEALHSAVAAARALGTSGLARVDLLVGNDARVWILEVNTVPGLTPRSLAPRAAAQAGLEMASLCDLLVRRCLHTAEVS